MSESKSKHRGTIKWYSRGKHFGFIIKHAENAEVFFHINDCIGFDPTEGVEVEFEEGLDKNRRTKAIDVTLIKEENKKENKITQETENVSVSVGVVENGDIRL